MIRHRNGHHQCEFDRRLAALTPEASAPAGALSAFE